jgi:lipopolysaccharide export system permease protein
VTRFDKYILSQLLMLFGLFSLILVMIYWVNRAVVLFDQLIANGQSAGVFLEFTILSLPNVIRLVLPVAGFAAALYVANRLTQESELVVARASGQSPQRLMRPVLVFGTIVAVMVGLLTHVLVPQSIAKLSERQVEISENITARLLSEGTFLHPSSSLTFYIREITPEGELRDVFVNDARDAGETVSYSARQALLIKSDTGPKLVMFDGMVQSLAHDSQRLTVTTFDDFAFDIGALIGQAISDRRSMKELSTLELLRPTEALSAETGAPAAVLLSEGHGRTSQALLAIVAATVGFAAMMVGGFSRFGLWRQIGGALLAIIVLKSIDNALADAARADPSRWPLAYGAPALGMLTTAALLWLGARPKIFVRPLWPFTRSTKRGLAP